jgi:hypothetical protein
MTNNYQSSIDAELQNLHNHNIDTKNREIFLHSYLVDSETDPGVDYKSAVVFEKNLRYLNSISSERFARFTKPVKFLKMLFMSISDCST